MYGVVYEQKSRALVESMSASSWSMSHSEVGSVEGKMYVDLIPRLTPSRHWVLGGKHMETCLFLFF